MAQPSPPGFNPVIGEFKLGWEGVRKRNLNADALNTARGSQSSM
jgi:hypothetical protein